MSLDATVLDQVIKKTIDAVENSKHEIFDIAEQAHKECETIKKELDHVKQEVVDTIEECDNLEKDLAIARQNLVIVSRQFDHSNEPRIRKAYEQAHTIQSQLFLAREREKTLRTRRDELEQRLIKLKSTVEKAEGLVTQMSVVLNYLAGDIQHVGQLIEDAKQQRDLGFKVIQAQEEERKRVARDIHDGPAQSMANVVLRTEIVERIFDHEGIEKAKEELRDLKKLVRDSLADVRRIIFDLRPMALDDLGLVPTLNKYIEALIEKHTLDIQFKVFGKENRLPSTIEVALFRLIQESLTNVIKHAEATMAQVKVEFQDSMIYVVIEDDGKGFEIDQQKSSGFGIMGMKERVKLLEGDMIIKSSRNAGTKMVIKIPIQEA